MKVQSAVRSHIDITNTLTRLYLFFGAKHGSLCERGSTQQLSKWLAHPL